MSAEDNKETILYAFKHQFDLPAYSALLAEDFTATTIADPDVFPRALKPRSKEEHLAGVARTADVFIDDDGNPGMTLTATGVTVEGDRVAVEVVATARLRSDPSRRVKNRSHGIWEFGPDGKITAHRAYEDTAYLLSLWSDEAEYIVPTGDRASSA